MDGTREAEDSDGTIVERVLHGRPEAFDLLVQRHMNRLRSVLAISCLGTDECQEHLQEAFVQAFIHLHRFDRHQAFFPWLRAIAINSLRMDVRRKRSRVEHGPDYIRHLQRQRMEEDPDGAAADGRAEALAACLKGLSHDHQGILSRCYGGSRPLAEVALDLGIGLGALKVRLHRLREALRGCIQRRIARQGR